MNACNIRSLFGLLFSAYCHLATAENGLPTKAQPPTPGHQFVGWTTNGPAVLAIYTLKMPTTFTNARGNVIPLPVPKQYRIMTNFVFEQFLSGSLNNLIWTNLLAHTNGRSTRVWSDRSHPENWPTNAPTATWDTNGLIWGRRGLTALSPCWETEGSPGQVPVTALTRRHGYTRGHSLGPEGFSKVFAGKHVWFFTRSNTVVSRTVLRSVGRIGLDGKQRDYTILLLDEDLPASIEPLRVTSFTNILAKYPVYNGVPWPLFRTEQAGGVSADLPGFTLNTWKGGDSGSPNMLPMPGELVFFGGRSTTGPTPDMQADMDELCRLEGLNPKRYQLQWVDLSSFPFY